MIFYGLLIWSTRHWKESRDSNSQTWPMTVLFNPLKTLNLNLLVGWRPKWVSLSFSCLRWDRQSIYRLRRCYAVARLPSYRRTPHTCHRSLVESGSMNRSINQWICNQPMNNNENNNTWAPPQLSELALGLLGADGKPWSCIDDLWGGSIIIPCPSTTEPPFASNKKRKATQKTADPVKKKEDDDILWFDFSSSVT